MYEETGDVSIKDVMGPDDRVRLDMGEEAFKRKKVLPRKLVRET